MILMKATHASHNNVFLDYFCSGGCLFGQRFYSYDKCFSPFSCYTMWRCARNLCCSPGSFLLWTLHGSISIGIKGGFTPALSFWKLQNFSWSCLIKLVKWTHSKHLIKCHFELKPRIQLLLIWKLVKLGDIKHVNTDIKIIELHFLLLTHQKKKKEMVIKCHLCK